MFQKRMQRSAVPPPLASRPCWCGDHAIALTAAVWSPNLMVGAVECNPHTYSWLSLPPLAISRSSGDHLSPHTCACTGGTSQKSHSTTASPGMLLHSDKCSAVEAAASYLQSPAWHERPWHGKLVKRPVMRSCISNKSCTCGPHLRPVAEELGLEVFWSADVALQDVTISRTAAQQVAAPGHDPHTRAVASHCPQPAYANDLDNATRDHRHRRAT